ncbi:hypothetical protein C7212DRAFT_362394 [Tuber magnatum]|uniref:DUF6589 domain-containing protein n=1 Tax=Tuber magnatum TaxID=42249 RepID=A0A317STW9_9PEZI|nr:hypothetical protein C7212DRAFT_362394 [Tuber magnatum]
MRYCHSAMLKQRMLGPQGFSEPRYKIANPPLQQYRANNVCADYLTFPTLDIDEASIAGAINILKCLVELLGLDEQIVQDAIIWLSRDYLTVWNVARPIYRWVEHTNKIVNFCFFKPIARLFHVQMNVLKMLFDTFEGSCVERKKLKESRREIRKRVGPGTSSIPLPQFDKARKEQRIRKELGASNWDTGLIYRNFGDACSTGFSERAAACIEGFLIVFQQLPNCAHRIFKGTTFKNYAAECLHLVACVKWVWKPEFRRAWLDFCLIKPTPKEGYWCTTDHYRETIIRGNKDKVRPSANDKGDDFLLNIIGPNILTLEAINRMVYTASRLSNYGMHHLVIDWYADVAQGVLELAYENVFTCKAGRGSTGPSCEEDGHPEGDSNQLDSMENEPGVAEMEDLQGF